MLRQKTPGTVGSCVAREAARVAKVPGAQESEGNPHRVAAFHVQSR